MSVLRVAVGWGYAPGSGVETPDAPRDVTMLRAQHNRIAYWLGALHRVPSIAEIIEHWGVSRSQAYRWRAFARWGEDEIVQPIHKRQ